MENNALMFSNQNSNIVDYSNHDGSYLVKLGTRFGVGKTTPLIYSLRVMAMVFNATFNKISVISWRWVLLVEETGGPGKNHRHVVSPWQTLSHNVEHLAPLFIVFCESIVSLLVSCVFLVLFTLPRLRLLITPLVSSNYSWSTGGEFSAMMHQCILLLQATSFFISKTDSSHWGKCLLYSYPIRCKIDIWLHLIFYGSCVIFSHRHCGFFFFKCFTNNSTIYELTWGS